jgi:hypothetical protein
MEQADFDAIADAVCDFFQQRRPLLEAL